ncbi:MAG: AAA family ATPase [Rhodocyclaceae bacterium]|nr:AAA family ATPase [Rhodocyclaceae bacterium]
MNALQDAQAQMLASAHALAARARLLQQRLEAAGQRQTQLLQRAGLHKAFLEHAPEAQAVLDEAQRRVNQHIVAGLSTVLSYLLQAVLADPDRSIVCETELDARAQAQLRFCVQRAEGEQEDILSGNGGSVANVVCTGLRLLAVQRAARARKFLVLDEPDCWLAPDRVSAFVHALSRATQAMAEPMQVLLITHHDLAQADAQFDIVDLLQHEQRLQVRAQLRQAALAHQIRSVRLINWRSHTDTVVPLGAGVTVLRGANNLGKSAVVEALRCLFYGGARADVVRHGQDEARVVLELANGQTLEMTRRRRGAPAVLYRWLDSNAQLLREEIGARGSAPEWIEQACGIAAVEGLQVHVADQKRPLFLLDEPASRQMALLSIGQEAQAMSELTERFRQRKRSEQQSLREAEEVLERLRRLQIAVQEERPALAQAQDLPQKAQALQQQVRRLADARALLQAMRPLQALQQQRLRPADLALLPDIEPLRQAWAQWQALRQLRPVRSLLGQEAVGVPALRWQDMAPLRSCLLQLRRLHPLQSLPMLAPPASLPDPAQAALAAQLVHKLRALRPVLSLRATPCEALVFQDGRLARELCDQWRHHIETGRALRAELTQLEQQHAAQTLELEQLQQQLGTCPLCSSPFCQHEQPGPAVRRRSASDLAAHRAAH